MRKWWLDRVSQDGDGIMDAYPHTEGDPELPDFFWIKVVAVEDVRKRIEDCFLIHDTRPKEDHGQVWNELREIFKQLENKSGGGSEPQRYNSVDGSMDSGGSLVSLEDYQELQRENASLSKINDDFEIAYQNDIREKQYLVNQRNSAEAERDKLKSLLRECVEDLKQATAPLNQDPLKNAAEIMTERWAISFKILERLNKDQKGSEE